MWQSRAALQRGLRNLVKQAVRNLKFDRSTCEASHLGWSSTLLDTNRMLLGQGADHKNLHGLMYHDRNTDQQCTRGVMKANDMLDCVVKSLQQVFIPFSELIRPLLEQCPVDMRNFGEFVVKQQRTHQLQRSCKDWFIYCGEQLQGDSLINLEKAAAKDMI